jgi:hypothetical protein
VSKHYEVAVATQRGGGDRLEIQRIGMPNLAWGALWTRLLRKSAHQRVRARLAWVRR